MWEALRPSQPVGVSKHKWDVPLSNPPRWIFARIVFQSRALLVKLHVSFSGTTPKITACFFCISNVSPGWSLTQIDSRWNVSHVKICILASVEIKILQSNFLPPPPLLIFLRKPPRLPPRKSIITKGGSNEITTNKQNHCESQEEKTHSSCFYCCPKTAL